MGLRSGFSTPSSPCTSTLHSTAQHMEDRQEEHSYNGLHLQKETGTNVKLVSVYDPLGINIVGWLVPKLGRCIWLYGM